MEHDNILIAQLTAVKASTLKDGIEFATRKAKLICNLITLKTLKPILPIYKGCSIIEAEDKTQVIAKARFRVIEELKVDLHEEEISNTEAGFGESLEHYSTDF